jgi:hypothetical protein
VAAFAPDGKRLLTGGSRFDKGFYGILCLWDVATGKELRLFRGHPGAVRDVAISADGKTIVSGAEDSSVRLWNADTGAELRRLVGHQHWVIAVALSPGGDIVASAGARTIRLWEAGTGKLLRTLPAPGSATSLAFSPDGKVLVSAAHDEVVRLWEVATGKEVRQWNGHRNVVHTVAFAPDGRSVASGGRDTLILVWDVTGIQEMGQLPKLRLAEKELRELWDDLAGEDVLQAHRAIWKLVSAGDQGVEFLKARLPRVPRPERRQIARLIRDLDSDEFAAREKASAELEKYAEGVSSALRQALEGKPSLEVRSRIESLLRKLETEATATQRLRNLRALQVLEQSGTAAARQTLKDLAGGAVGAPLTSEAKASLDRLTRRQGGRP